jgi:predicted metal-binding protein
MPQYDGTGPCGNGPMSGRGRGYCVLKLPDTTEGPVRGFVGKAGWPFVGAISGQENTPGDMYRQIFSIADGPQTNKSRKNKMLKVGIIRCQQTEDMCPGNTDFKVAQEGKCAFEEMGPVEVVGFVSCGGCPGKRAVTRAATMVERGADIIVLASCMTRGNPIGIPCPNYQRIKEAIIKKVGKDIKIIEWTH